MNFVQKLAEVKDNVLLHWNQPPKGRYMNYREIVSFSGGGLGVYSVIVVVSAMILSTGNTLIGNTIGVDPRTMYILFVLGVLSSFPLTALRANIIDNTRSKKGKYRPFIIRMGIPCVILAIAFVWMPYEKMEPMVKYAVILLFNIAFQFFFNFFRDSYENLIYVLSPNSQERTDVVAIKSVVYSLAPSIIGIMMPLLAGWLTNGDLNDIRLYRYAYPPIAIIGMCVSGIVYFNTREKIVQAKTHIIQIKFMDAIRAVAKNKYFWILALAGWLGFLEGAQGQILYWLYQYGGKCSPSQYSLIILLAGNASLWGMMFAPFAIKKYGKKKVLIVTNICNIFFIAALYPFIDSIWLVLVFIYMNSIVASFSHVLDPSIQADIRDYQQYVTGERIDGMFAAVGLIGSVITLGTSSVLPAIYRAYGIFEGNGQLDKFGRPNPWEILRQPETYNSLIRVLILASVCGAVLNVIPYFFYDLKETKQRGIVNVLKIRALFEDYGNNALSDEDLVEAINLVREARVYAVAENSNELSTGIDTAKKTGDKIQIRSAKKDRKAAVEHNKMIEISQMVMEEMNKFGTAHVQNQVELAEKIVNAGLAGLVNVDKSVVAQAKTMPKNTKEEKLLRKEAINLAKARLASKKLIYKNYPNGINVFDTAVFDNLFDREDEAEEDLETAYQNLFDAQSRKLRHTIKQAKLDVKNAKVTRREIHRAIKVATNEHSLFRRTTKPYQDAVKLLTQKENYRHFDDIAAMFDAARARKEENERLKKEDEDREKAERFAEIERLKQEKEIAKQNKAFKERNKTGMNKPAGKKPKDTTDKKGTKKKLDRKNDNTKHS